MSNICKYQTEPIWFIVFDPDDNTPRTQSKMKAYLLLALCLCASSTVISTPPDAPLGAAPSDPQYLRSLKDQAAAAADANAAAAANNVDADVKKIAIHRTYDTVTGLYCEKVGVCHVCPASEKVRLCVSTHGRGLSLWHVR
jgi:hypothetical protein